MNAASFNNMSSDFAVFQAFSTRREITDTVAVKERLQEQIAWTEEKIAELQAKLERLECQLEVQPY